jgi:Dolichyl-phosphate-mannose-protein mannosyltransferase
MKLLQDISRSKVLLFFCLSALIGLSIFRDYGFTWDEPLFYKYADALGYAYNPANWFSGHFDLNQSYGPSATDHKTRGPAYLLLAREPVYLIEKLNIHTDDAWHLVNFLTFLLGVFFLYKISERFMSSWAALAAAGLFMLQPLLWGHAFINPKDLPFLVFLTGSIFLGFRMVDRLPDALDSGLIQSTLNLLLPAIFLGLATSIRVLGPLAGVLVFLYFLTRKPTRKSLAWIVLYALVAMVVMLATWPYLWENPLKFGQVFQFMSDNPTGLQVLFADQVYRAYDVPLRYLPFYLFFTLTEPVWPLFFLGLIAALLKVRRDSQKLVLTLLIFSWFAIPLAYDILRRPPIYDGMRHFLFMLPPVFIIAGFAIDFLFERINRVWINASLVLVMLAPGILGIIQLHPYEYTYYNSLIGGTGSAFRHYETDFWLTCYKQAVLQFDQLETQPVKLYIHREPDVATPYAASNVTVLDERGALNQISSGDYVLVNTRTNEDRRDFHDAPVILTVGRAGATYCEIKKIP